jgi:hypothetical protein
VLHQLLFDLAPALRARLGVDHFVPLLLAAR